MKRTLLIRVTAKERDYLIRVLRNEQAHWLSVAGYRERGRAPGHTHEEHVAFVLDAKSRAEAASSMAIRVKNAETKRQMEDRTNG